MYRTMNVEPTTEPERQRRATESIGNTAVGFGLTGKLNCANRTMTPTYHHQKWLQGNISSERVNDDSIIGYINFLSTLLAPTGVPHKYSVATPVNDIIRTWVLSPEKEKECSKIILSGPRNPSFSDLQLNTR